MSQCRLAESSPERRYTDERPRRGSGNRLLFPQWWPGISARTRRGPRKGAPERALPRWGGLVAGAGPLGTSGWLGGSLGVEGDAQRSLGRPPTRGPGIDRRCSATPERRSAAGAPITAPLAFALTRPPALRMLPAPLKGPQVDRRWLVAMACGAIRTPARAVGRPLRAAQGCMEQRAPTSTHPFGLPRARAAST